MDIDKELLYHFFAQETSIDEQRRIKEWLEESEAHRVVFLRERKLYDILILNENSEIHTKYHYYLLKKWSVVILSIAAVLIIVIVSTVYFTKESLRNNDLNNIITVPQGQRTSLILSDGTKVWLNANTRFEYPQSFKIYNTRTVKIDGEAYFEVSKDKSHPFIVNTPYGNIQALGTKFDVEAYSKTKKCVASLLEGKIRVSTNKYYSVLLPSEKAVIKDGKLSCTYINDYDVYRWRDGLYCFKNKKFCDILKDFEKYYDIKFIQKRKPFPSTQISGKFRLIDGVDFAMKVLQQSANFKYHREEDTNIIYIY